MTKQVDAFQRAAKAIIDLLASRPSEVGRYRSGLPQIERKQALEAARVIKIMAAAALAAADAAVQAFTDPPPPEQHYHNHPAPAPLRPLGGVGRTLG